MSNFRTMLLSTVAAGLVAVAVSPASAGEVEKSVWVNGRVNQVFVAADNGENTTVAVTDNSNVSGSRFGVNAAAKSESMSIGAKIELGTNASATTESNSTTRSTSLRQAVINVSSGNMGTLTFGLDYSAADGTSYRDASSTANSGGWQGTVANSELFRVANDTSTNAGTVTVGAANANFGGGSRDSVIKYSSVNMGGFQAVASFGNRTNGEAALFYDADFDGTKVGVSIGYQGGYQDNNMNSQIASSLSVSLAGGLNGSVGYSKENQQAAGTNDGSQWGASLGYTMGDNAISAFYRSTEDAVANGDEGTGYGVLVNHSLAAYGANLYGGIANYTYDTAAGGTKYDDLTSGWVGIRVNF